ncbi:jg4808 [Pararge aegeria aegeria]|uniref:Jg4808 protein n=1 Tax=Pararge aegeria aegeria TaxID=348720 RepID=A0A8S4SD72_9NEOP|nr:jg4808 [Pararge aegeria aegeria]
MPESSRERSQRRVKSTNPHLAENYGKNPSHSEGRPVPCSQPISKVEAQNSYSPRSHVFEDHVERRGAGEEVGIIRSDRRPNAFYDNETKNVEMELSRVSAKGPYIVRKYHSS